MWGTGRKHFKCVDLHCGGEPARVLVSSAPAGIAGVTMADKRRDLMENHDYLRKLLLHEPRGYPCQNTNILFPSTQPEAEFGYVICEQNRIYPLFSGHNTICVATALLETGLIQMEEPVTNFKLESPGGLINVSAECNYGSAKSITLTSMPSFVKEPEPDSVFVPSLDTSIPIFTAFGGMWYAIVFQDLKPEVLPKIRPENAKRLASLGEEIKEIMQRDFPAQHPVIKEYKGPDILMFAAKLTGNRYKTTVVMSCGKTGSGDPYAMLDRSPCGSGTAALMALLWEEQKIQGGEIINESIIGSEFKARIKELGPEIGNRKSIIPEITGRAFITGFNELVINPEDPYQQGFTLSDIWATSDI